jgi:ADP-ribose pyrophosphatase
MKKVFRGRLLKVYVKKVRLPNGYKATFEMVRHPGAILVVPFINKNTVIMLRQLRPVIEKFIYELPAGTIDKGEAPASCARREIIEETGYSAKRLTFLGAIYPVPGYSTEKIYIYKAEGLSKKDRVAEKDEVIENHFMSKAEVRRLFKRGRITDAKTIAALAMSNWL